MKKDDKHAKDKPDRKIIRHPTAPFTTKSIIMNLIIAFFLYVLRRVIGLYPWSVVCSCSAICKQAGPLMETIFRPSILEAGGKSAITKYSRFIK